ncbi:TPA: hypothetical protein I8271_001117 [Kluyvera intermedia]|uniref:Uncharacterized protein n=1 Tax=Kluyvera intermedia TaxID=61648 RepID=A0A9P3WEM5_KLUIN|nr:hypothetical protein [Phytobacter ursingii]HAT2204301.1 hypothetical protein [Kluyvera intermedia]HAT2517257.1 hypothetical protein [Kluyvera intermedia]HAT2605258.1 hypothetical protein [Kluyvera intermedia]HAT2679624.1 hypothetical protein [Kluyvera intermedia]HAT2695795.1 hypothetical protein [Kluyvera intermedia]
MIELINSTEFWSGLIGAVIGGLFTLWGTLIEGNRERKTKEDDLLTKKINILKGVKTEIELITALYNQRMNSHINNYKDGQILDVYFLITQNNFVFYESNAEFISELDENVLKDVVRFYITAKSLIDTFNTNNTNINKISEIAIKIAEEPMNESYRGLLAAYTNIASQYAPMIIEINNETLRCQQQVILSINREIEKLEK